MADPSFYCVNGREVDKHSRPKFFLSLKLRQCSKKRAFWCIKYDTVNNLTSFFKCRRGEILNSHMSFERANLDHSLECRTLAPGMSSTTRADAPPPPLHTAPTPYFPFLCLSTPNNVTKIRAPLHPNGCPKDTAPP